MRTTRLACAAAVLCASAGAAFAQSAATIVQSGSNDQARIEQDASTAGSVLDAAIVQTRGEENRAIVQQVPGSASGSIAASARITQWATSYNFATVLQSGTTGGTTLDLRQDGGSDTSAQLTQANVSDASISARQSAFSASMWVEQSAGSASVSIEADQRNGWGSGIAMDQGAQGWGRATNSEARVFQDGGANSATTSQGAVDTASAYISQGSSQMPGYYSTGGTWVEVDGTVIATPATESTATIAQGPGNNLTGYILQYGTAHSARVSQSGAYQVGGILQTGSGNTAAIDQMGSYGTASIAQYGNGAYAWTFQNGVGNTATIKQR